MHLLLYDFMITRDVSAVTAHFTGTYVQDALHNQKMGSGLIFTPLLCKAANNIQVKKY